MITEKPSVLWFPDSSNISLWRNLNNSLTETYNIAGQEFIVMALKQTVGRYGEDCGYEVTLVPSYK